ncbi:cell division protein FtsQ/DivIB [Herminiimonas sp. CN]|uniref:cell division protein FtsQ/DivIB n=1 Tax=Herminiimonas sp. CN TaxID=1349818 RepID=UPI000473B5BA|nr:cell division protein FtsQ/DivIB [Herminiimonas sp. CN]
MWQEIKTLNAIASTLFAVFALLLFSAGIFWLTQRPMFTLKAIRVESADAMQLQHVNRLTVKGAAISRIQGNFFTANLDAVRMAFESVPWVRKATVRREWPNKLVVSVEEHEPLGTWGENGRLVSVKGDVFTANLAEAEENGDLPEFNGPEGAEKEVIARFDEFKQWFAPLRLAPESIRLSDRYAWSVKLDNGIALELGREQDKAMMRERVDRFVNIYPQLAALLQNRIESVDMRYPNGLALKVSGIAPGLESKRK